MPRRASIALLGAVCGTALLLLTWYAAYHIGFVERGDQSILNGFIDLQRPRADGIANFIAHLCNPSPYVYFAAIPVLVALIRGRPWVAATIAAILLGANATTELIKPLLATPHGTVPVGQYSSVAYGSWPSGHATAAMSLALTSVLAAPARLRPVVAAVGAGFAVAVSYSFLTLGWHYPSDVLGGYLVASVWTLLGVGFLSARQARWPQELERDRGARLPVGNALRPPALALLAAIAAAALVAVARPHPVVGFARSHELFVIGAATIGAVGLAIVTGVMLAVRR
jgi:membrane-associated phospholipid phosphatase